MKIEKRLVISSAHKLNLPYESPCNGLHGHNWIIDICLESDILLNDMVIDFTEIKKIVMQLDHTYLNDVKGLENPTVENIVLYLIDRFIAMNRFSRIKVGVQETESSSAEHEWKSA